jgi:dTDP-4-dehydrorhamnose 3,5-epimerase
VSRLGLAATPLRGLMCIERKQRADERGFFSRVFCSDELAAAGWQNPIVQINQSYTTHRGTVRGMHYQRPPHSEMKLVSCLQGEVWDVAVDLRHGSPTFLQWHAQRLSEHNGCAMLIPPGFAHGFQALSEGATLLYCHSTAFNADADAGLYPLDPRLAIAWPLPAERLSPRDAGQLLLTPDFEGVVL